MADREMSDREMSDPISAQYYRWRAEQLMRLIEVLDVDEQVRILEAIEAEATRRLVKLRLER